jgi:hypothetical protein
MSKARRGKKRRMGEDLFFSLQRPKRVGLMGRETHGGG